MTNELIFSHNPAVRKGAAQESELLEKLFSILFRVIHDIPPSTEKPTSEALLRAHKLIADASFGPPLSPERLRCRRDL